MAVLGLVFVLCVILFCITLVRMAGAQPLYEQKNPYEADRQTHMGQVHTNQEGFDSAYRAKDGARNAQAQKMDQDRAKHQSHMSVTSSEWVQDYNNKKSARDRQNTAMDAQRVSHSNDIQDKPKEWWDGWVARYIQANP